MQNPAFEPGFCLEHFQQKCEAVFAQDNATK
jgi:hypothetical protein